MKAERRTIAPGTARKPASRKRFSPQPANFEGTLSHQVAPPGPPSMTALSLRRNDSSTAFFSHWLTFQEPGPSAPSIFSATRASPLSSSVERPVDRVAHVAARLGVDRGAILEGAFDEGLQGGVGHDEPFEERPRVFPLRGRRLSMAGRCPRLAHGGDARKADYGRRGHVIADITQPAPGRSVCAR